jgi:hydrogenase maturation protease
MTTDQPLLILGIGNRILSDDGIGIKLIEDLQDEFRHPRVHFKTACTGGLEIVEMMQNYRNVLILDAIKLQGGRPGNIYYYTVEDFKETLHISSFHDISFLIALEFMKRSGLKVPEDIRIVAIEILEDSYFSEAFSQVIQKKYRKILKEVRLYLQKYLNNKFIKVAEVV